MLDAAYGRPALRRVNGPLTGGVGTLRVRRIWMHDIVGKPDNCEQTDHKIREIELPPPMTVGGTALIFVMVVVPTSAMGQETDKPVVATIVVGFIVAVAPNMPQRIDGPCDVPDRDRSYKYAPYQQA